MNIAKKLSTIGTLLITTLCLTGCGNNDNNTAKVNIGYFNNVTHAQALLMKSEESLEKALGEDIKVNWTSFNAGPAEVEALFSEDIDIGYIGPVPAVNANVKSNGDVMILTGATKGGAVVVKNKDSQINSISDFAGKNVAIPQIGNTQHLSLLKLLSDNNLKPVTEGGDVNITAVSNADVANVMERGDIDAAIVPEPWGATLEEAGAELFLDYDEIYMDGNYDVAVVVVRKEFLEKHPDIVEAFLEEHNAASERLTSDTENALQTINNELQNATGKALSDSIIQKSFDRILIDTTLNKESILGFANIGVEQNLMSDVPDESDLFVSTESQK